MPFVSELPWSSLDPKHLGPRDVRLARKVVAAIFAEAATDLPTPQLRPGWDRHALQAALSQALMDALGPWAGGLTWAASDGGLVRAYCCAGHSLLPKGETVGRSIDRVLDAYVEWREQLEGLEATFATLRADTASLSLEHHVEKAASTLLPIVLERNAAEEAWYHAFATVLRWYLESAGVAHEAIAPTIDHVASAHFASWVAPSADVARAAAQDLGLEVALSVAKESFDGLEAWAALRKTAFPTKPSRWQVRASWDGHRRFIEGPESRRDPERARRMGTALDSCRASALKRTRLDFELLAKWQSIVLDAAAPFRTTVAFAKHGRESYGIDATTKARFEAWLREANDTSTDVLVRAARVYLDVCFVHPFADGNARAARLALDFVLAREGYVLRVAEPVFVLSRAADDAEGPTNLLRALAFCAAKR